MLPVILFTVLLLALTGSVKKAARKQVQRLQMKTSGT